MCMSIDYAVFWPSISIGNACDWIWPERCLFLNPSSIVVNGISGWYWPLGIACSPWNWPCCLICGWAIIFPGSLWFGSPCTWYLIGFWTSIELGFIPGRNVLFLLGTRVNNCKILPIESAAPVVRLLVSITFSGESVDFLFWLPWSRCERLVTIQLRHLPTL